MASNIIDGDKSNLDTFRASRDLPEMHKIAVEALEYDRGLVQRCVAVAVGIGEAKTDVQLSQIAEIASNTVTHMNSLMIEMQAMMVEMRQERKEMVQLVEDSKKEIAVNSQLNDLGSKSNRDKYIGYAKIAGLMLASFLSAVGITGAV